MGEGLIGTKYFRTYVIISLIFFIAIIPFFYYLGIWTAGNPEIVTKTAAAVTDYGILGIFLFAILAGTVIPFPTEPIFGAMAVLGDGSIMLLILAASLGNALGTVISFYLARYFREAYVYKHVDKKSIKSFHDFWFQHGDWLLFVTLLIPVLPGDIVAFVAGLSKMDIKRFFIISMSAKLIEFSFFAVVSFKVAEAWFPMLI